MMCLFVCLVIVTSGIDYDVFVCLFSDCYQWNRL